LLRGRLGGIFAPLLFFGAMAGVLVTGLTSSSLGLTAQDPNSSRPDRMTACLGAGDVRYHLDDRDEAGCKFALPL
jgi:H+/Cl- antiporter ClcA